MTGKYGHNMMGIHMFDEEKVLEIFKEDEVSWKKCMKMPTNTDDTPMRKLIRIMPDVAKLVLDKCTKPENKGSEFKVLFDYTYLDDTYLLNEWRGKGNGMPYTSDRKRIKENHPLMIMVTSKRTELLDHPLVSALLKRKWMSIGLIFSIVNLLIYAVFLALLIGFTLSIRSPFELGNSSLYNHSECRECNNTPTNNSECRECNNAPTNNSECRECNNAPTNNSECRECNNAPTNNAPTNNSECRECNNAPTNNSECRECNNAPTKNPECKDITDQHISVFVLSAQIGVYVLATTELLIEIFEIKQMYWPKLWNYFFKLENLSEWITCLAAMIFVTNMSDCDDTGLRLEWQWTVGSISVLLAWVNLLFMLQKFEWIGIYVVMLYRIVKMFVKFFLVFSLLIVAFAISFYCLFRNQEQFRNVGISLVKATSMMIGDTDFGTIFFDETVHFDFISYIFFYIFMIFMTILVINLLVGLTVDNIQEFKKEAGLAKKRMQVHYALELERFSTSTLFAKSFGLLLKKCCPFLKIADSKLSETFTPREQSFLQRKISESWKLTERDITAGLNIDSTSRDIAQLEKKITKLESYIKTKLENVPNVSSA